MSSSPSSPRSKDASSVSEGVSNSKFYMLRCVIAMAHADGVIDDLEIAYINSLINHIPLSESQRKALRSDLDAPQDPFDLLRQINEPVYRGQVVHFARLMAYKDGILDPSEKDLLNKLNINVTDGLDMDTIRAAVDEAVTKEMLLHDIEIDKTRPKKGDHFIPWFQLLDELLLSLGIDLIRD